MVVKVGELAEQATVTKFGIRPWLPSFPRETGYSSARYRYISSLD